MVKNKSNNFDLLKKAGEQTVILGKLTLGAGTSLMEIFSGRSLIKSRSWDKKVYIYYLDSFEQIDTAVEVYEKATIAALRKYTIQITCNKQMWSFYAEESLKNRKSPLSANEHLV